MPDSPRARGERIRAAIKGTGLTQGDAALAIGVSRPSVVQWLLGGEITEESLERLCKLTGKDAAWIRYGVEPGVSGAVDRYIEGYAEARADAIEKVERVAEELRRMYTSKATDAKPPADREVERAGDEVEGTKKESKKRRA